MGLTDVNGTLYGTTTAAGAKGAGTVFKITTSGAETVLHAFGGGSDGAGANALTNVNGVLYGTTASGGVDYKTGTVYKITTSGLKSTVYRFRGGSDGSRPQSTLLDV